MTFCRNMVALTGGMLMAIAEVLLLVSLFHHKPKPKPLTPEQQAFAKLIELDKKLYADGIAGAEAFEADVRFAQYERPEIDAFERQLFVCSQETDPHKFDADIDVLSDLGQQLMALDDLLHHEEAI